VNPGGLFDIDFYSFICYGLITQWSRFLQIENMFPRGGVFMPAKIRLIKEHAQKAFLPAFAELTAIPLSISAQIAMLNGDANFMTSLARGLAVVQAFSNRKHLLTVSQLSIKTGFSRAAVRRCIYTLSKLGFVGTDDNQHFYLRPRILSLGYSGMSSIPMMSAAQPVLEHMSHRSPESCWIGTLDGNETICAAHANATRLNSIEIQVGGRMSAFSTSIGRVLLANLSPEEQESLVEQTEFRPSHNRTTPYSADKIRQILSLTRRKGYSIVNQELERGVWALAVPIHNPSGIVVAGLGIAVLSQGESSESMLLKFLPRLQHGATRLGLLLK
jgi:IclR family pca regulon transcriptional regulator